MMLWGSFKRRVSSSSPFSPSAVFYIYLHEWKYTSSKQNSKELRNKDCKNRRGGRREWVTRALSLSFIFTSSFSTFHGVLVLLVCCCWSFFPGLPSLLLLLPFLSPRLTSTRDSFSLGPKKEWKEDEREMVKEFLFTISHQTLLPSNSSLTSLLSLFLPLFLPSQKKSRQYLQQERQVNEWMSSSLLFVSQQSSLHTYYTTIIAMISLLRFFSLEEQQVVSWGKTHILSLSFFLGVSWRWDKNKTYVSREDGTQQTFQETRWGERERRDRNFPDSTADEVISISLCLIFLTDSRSVC